MKESSEPKPSMPSTILAPELSLLRSALVEYTVPTYVLDENFRYVDWNPAFDELIAKPLGLRFGMHGTMFVSYLENCEAVMSRALEVFAPGKHPLTDTESVVLKHPKYGLMKFQKFAIQVLDAKGQKSGWVLTLDIMGADHLELLWTDLMKRFEREVLWHAVLSIFMPLLPCHLEGKRLLKLMSDNVPTSGIILEIGGGTGVLTRLLSRAAPSATLWALEENHFLFARTKQALISWGTPVQVLKGNFDTCEDQGVASIQTLVSLLGMSRMAGEEELTKALEKSAEILVPGGELRLVIFNPERLEGLADAVFSSATAEQLIARDNLGIMLRSLREKGFLLPETTFTATLEKFRLHIRETVSLFDGALQFYRCQKSQIG